MILAFVAGALALSLYDVLEVELVGGEVLEGRYLRPAAADRFVMDHDGEEVVVGLATVRSVEVNGEGLELAVFGNQLSERWEHLQDLRHGSPKGRAPLPLVVGTGSALFAGTGHAMLGEGKQFRGYAALQTVLLGAEAFALFYDENPALFISVAAVDLFVRGVAVSDTVREARRRRRGARD